MKSDFKVHIKAKPEQQRGMICFNVDLKIRFYFEFGNTRTTIQSCEKNSALKNSLKIHIIEVHYGQWRTDILEDLKNYVIGTKDALDDKDLIT